MTVPVERLRVRVNSRGPLWIAALVHRLSGIALAAFLPLHFLALGLAIDGEARLNAFLAWANQPMVKLAEAGLVFLLGIHLLGGLRILLIETLGWRPGQGRIAVIAGAAAAALALVFLVRTL